VVDLILYDGVCGLCNGFVRFLLRRDSAGRFRFASLQSPLAQQLLQQHGHAVSTGLTSVFVIVNYGDSSSERLLAQSPAILHVLTSLGGAWRIVAFAKQVPVSWANALYLFVARHRYQWFGRSDTCPVPKPEDRAKFLDAT